MNVDFPKPGEEAQLQALWQLAFGDSPAFIQGFFETGYDRECCRRISMDGRIAAALYWFDTQWEGGKLAYLYAVATHPDFRNRGLCRTLMADAHRVLTERGYAGTLLTPAEPGLRRMYGTFGYGDCCRVSERAWAAGEPVPIGQIGGEEYAALRRRFLPKGGVIQEGRNIRYLETYGAFYAGEDFLLAGAADGDDFRGMELLGNGKAAPGILGALGYRKGIFRTPGEDKPFAMFLPLKNGAEPPEYFGLAFD